MHEVYSQPQLRPFSILHSQPRIKSSGSFVTPSPRVLSLRNSKSVGGVELSMSLCSVTAGAPRFSRLRLNLLRSTAKKCKQNDTVVTTMQAEDMLY